MLEYSTSNARLLPGQGNGMKEVSMDSDEFSIHRKHKMDHLSGQDAFFLLLFLPQDKEKKRVR